MTVNKKKKENKINKKYNHTRPVQRKCLVARGGDYSTAWFVFNAKTVMLKMLPSVPSAWKHAVRYGLLEV